MKDRFLIASQLYYDAITPEIFKDLLKNKIGYDYFRPVILFKLDCKAFEAAVFADYEDLDEDSQKFVK